MGRFSVIYFQYSIEAGLFVLNSVKKKIKAGISLSLFKG